jgi:cellulose 1,4-beta-cellobiosidase
LNPFRNGNKDFYGPGSNYKVDTTKPFTVVTQFHTSDRSSTGELSDIKRFYIQNGKKIEFPATKIDGLGPYNSINNDNCGSQKKVFGEPQSFASKGGMKAMGEALKRGMVLVMSIWDDHEAYMLWLDGEYPLNVDPNKAGVRRGPCSRESGKPWEVEKQFPNAYTSFRNIKFGDIDSTYQLSETQENTSNILKDE